MPCNAGRVADGQGLAVDRSKRTQVSDYKFDSSALEVVALTCFRLVILSAVLLRSRPSMVRVNGLGVIKTSTLAVMAQTVCWVSAAYCAFKVRRALTPTVSEFAGVARWDAISGALGSAGAVCVLPSCVAIRTLRLGRRV